MKDESSALLRRVAEKRATRQAEIERLRGQVEKATTLAQVKATMVQLLKCLGEG